MLRPDMFVDLEWINRISYKLDRFSSTFGKKVFSCRCPVCGDSKKDSKKTRFIIYNKKNEMNVYCHNCGYSTLFYCFMRDYFQSDFDEYKRDQTLNRLKPSRIVSKTLSVEDDKPYTLPEKTSQNVTEKVLDTCIPCVDLDSKHPAIKWLRSRCLTDKEIDRLYWSPNFKTTSEILSPTKLKETFPVEGRIMIPFFSEDGELEMMQGRSLNNKGLRYISIKRDEMVDKIFGKLELDRSKTIYCCEGPFDSLFVDNCIATCDSNLLRAEADVYIWDNEPRNPDIVKLIEKAIDQNKKVVIWPTSPDQKQDINDMIKMGLSREDINEIIQMCSYSGLKAKLEFKKWRKV